MQRRASIVCGATMAPVGQPVRQRVHEPQLLRIGSSAGISAELRMAPMNTHEPARAWVSRLLFLPIQPRPARAASARSAKGRSSTYATSPEATPSARRSLASASSRRRSEVW
jgi:hypothetical protein